MQSLFTASPIPGGYTWTLPSRLGQMLAEVESIFGERDKSYTILGVEIGPDFPRLWYPGDRKHIVIQLGPIAAIDEVLAHYQLAHECVHLLSPTGANNATVLEEGAAVAYSEDFVLREFRRTIATGLQSYTSVASLFRRLFQVDPQAIAKLRAVEPSFNAMTADHFASIVPNVDSGLVKELLTPFVRG